MRLRSHLIVTERDRDVAVDRIVKAFLDAHRLEPVDGRERGEALPATAPNPSSGPKARKPSQRLEQRGLLLGERLVVIYGFALTAVIVVIYLLRL